MRATLLALLVLSSGAVADPIDDQTLYLGPFGDDVTLTAPLGTLFVIGGGPLFDLIVPHGRTTTFDVFDLSYCHCQGGGYSYEINIGPYSQIVTMASNDGFSRVDGFVDALLGPGTYQVSTTYNGLLDMRFFTRPGEGIVHVPEPGTLSLLVGGLLAFFAMRKGRRATA